MKIGVFAGAAGLALSAAAFATNPLIDFRAMGANDQLETPTTSLGRLHQDGLRPLNGTVIQVTNGLGTVGRGSVEDRAGTVLAFTDDLNCLNVFPAVLRDQVGCPVWNMGITGQNFILGTTAAGRVTFAVADNIPGTGIDGDGPDANGIANNGPAKIRLKADTTLPLDSFVFGLRYEFMKQGVPPSGVRAALRPDAGKPTKIIHDLFVDSAANLFTSEPIYVTSGFITSRQLWGGTCNDADPETGCTSFGLPVGPVPNFFTLGVNPASFTTGIFRLNRWVGSAPTGEAINDPVPVYDNQWVSLWHETNADGNVVHFLDTNDGTGYHKMYEEPYLVGQRIDSLGGNSSYETTDSCYYDNLDVSGVEVTLPVPPEPLECDEDGYGDDAEWLFSGALKDQSDLWFDALSSKANVDSISGDQTIRQTNIFPDDFYREEFTRTLPLVTAQPMLPWQLCEEITISGAACPRGLALTSLTDGAFVARVFFGFFNPDTGIFDNGVFLQNDFAYNPYDGEVGDGGDPFANVAVRGTLADIGTPGIDIVDTGVNILTGARILCVEVESDTSMTVTYNGVELVGGSTGFNLPANAVSIDELRHESENLSLGGGGQVRIDDISLQCAGLPVVNLPPLTLRYSDDLEWGITGVTIDLHIDAANPDGPFRWASAASMPIAEINALGGTTKVLQMENLFQDTTQTQGDFTLFTQASTAVPNVVPVTNSRGWVVGGRFQFTDFDTTRAWGAAEETIVQGQFVLGSLLLFSQGTATFWVLTPDPVDPVNNDEIWVDTGRSLASLGIGANQWFRLTIHSNLNGTIIFKVNGAYLRDSMGAIVRTEPFQSPANGVADELDRFFFFGGDDDTSLNPGSILYADDIVAWALPCLGDTNDDGQVVFADINNILGVFNQPVGMVSPNFLPDANGDGVADDNEANFPDLNGALGQFNQPCD